MRHSMIFIIVTLLLSGCDSAGSNSNGDVANNNYKASATFLRVVPVASQTAFRLESINGLVRIETANSATSVSIAGVRTVESDSDSDAANNLANLDVDVSENQGEILVQTIQPQQTQGRTYTVDYTISLPPELMVVVNSVNGVVEIEEVSGSVRVNLINGDIVCSASDPLVGAIDLVLVNGNIDLGISSNASANISAEVINGQIATSDLTLESVVSTPRMLSGNLGSGTHDIRLALVNGTISISGN